MTIGELEILAEIRDRLQRVEEKLAWAMPTQQELEDQLDHSIDEALRVS